MERFLAFILPALVMIGCNAGKPVEDLAREVLWARLIGFIIVIAIAFFFVFRNLRKK